MIVAADMTAPFESPAFMTSGGNQAILEARAQDSAGNTAVSDPVTLQVSNDDDHSDHARAATSVSVPSTTGSTMGAGDVDYFRFTVPSDTQLLLRTILSTLPNPVLMLLAGDGATTLDLDDDGGTGLASEIRRGSSSQDAPPAAASDRTSRATARADLAGRAPPARIQAVSVNKITYFVEVRAFGSQQAGNIPI